MNHLCMVLYWSNNLLKLASLQSSSADQSKLNETQLKLVNLSTKYITLFGIGTVVVFISFTFQIAYHHTFWLYHVHIITTSIDCSISIICLYLQYTFASKYYKRYCNRLHGCCRKSIVQTMLKSISQSNGGYDGCPTTETAEIEPR